MAIVFTIRDYLDTIIDVVCVKSGIILTDDHVIQIINSRDVSWQIDKKRLDKVIRIRSEEVEDDIRFVRIKIGNLDEKISPYQFVLKLNEWHEKGVNYKPVFDAFIEISKDHQNKTLDPLFIVKEIRRRTKLPELFILEVIKLIADHQFQDSSYVPLEKAVWDGGTPLSKLFNCEIVPGDNTFFDQKFLDYLAKNQDDLEKIHWRNFERFCAEFFNRLGYVIQLGPGSKDGGIDIRAFDENNRQSPLIVIQCKRYKVEKKVDIETVKAFYTDVLFEKAKHGVIVTTSHVAPGGKKTSQARSFPLSFAENEDVKKWAQTMWRYK
jgi:restriction system protein